jgi:hypothetical protein
MQRLTSTISKLFCPANLAKNKIENGKIEKNKIENNKNQKTKEKIFVIFVKLTEKIEACGLFLFGVQAFTFS